MVVNDNKPYHYVITPGQINSTNITTNNLFASPQRIDKGFFDLTPAEFLEAFRNSELPKLAALVEDAKLMYEEEGDADSFGEYQGLQMAYDWLVSSLDEAKQRRYSAPATYPFGVVPQKYGVSSFTPLGGHTG